MRSTNELNSIKFTATSSAGQRSKASCRGIRINYVIFDERIKIVDKKFGKLNNSVYICGSRLRGHSVRTKKLQLCKQRSPIWQTDVEIEGAYSPEDARKIHPSEFVTHVKDGKWFGTYSKGGEYENEGSCWVAFSQIDQVQTEYLGETDRGRGVILASFNAGQK